MGERRLDVMAGGGVVTIAVARVSGDSQLDFDEGS